MKKKGSGAVGYTCHPPKVNKNATTSGIMRGSAGETGRAKPPQLGKVGPKKGNP